MAEFDDLIKKNISRRYLMKEVLGEGTYGVVYKAYDTQVHYVTTIFHLRLPYFFI